MSLVRFYEPKLPTDRAQLLQRYPMGSLMKIEAVYVSPFWRKRALLRIRWPAGTGAQHLR